VGPFLRLYGGGTYLIHRIPLVKPGSLQAGLELKTKDRMLSGKYPIRLYLAEDVQSHADVGWNVNSNATLGMRLGSKDGERAMRFYVGYFTGHSPYAQFQTQREHYAEIGFGFDF
jgi:hypothetical protein